MKGEGDEEGAVALAAVPVLPQRPEHHAELQGQQVQGGRVQLARAVGLQDDGIFVTQLNKSRLVHQALPKLKDSLAFQSQNQIDRLIIQNRENKFKMDQLRSKKYSDL